MTRARVENLAKKPGIHPYSLRDAIGYFMIQRVRTSVSPSLYWVIRTYTDLSVTILQKCEGCTHFCEILYI